MMKRLVLVGLVTASCAQASDFAWGCAAGSALAVATNCFLKPQHQDIVHALGAGSVIGANGNMPKGAQGVATGYGLVTAGLWIGSKCVKASEAQLAELRQSDVDPERVATRFVITSEEVEKNWNEFKEQDQRAGALSNLPAATEKMIKDERGKVWAALVGARLFIKAELNKVEKPYTK